MMNDKPKPNTIEPITMHRQDDLILDDATKKLLESITGQNWDKPIQCFSYLPGDSDND